MDTPRLRFAPSPSGFLHIGGARTALFCWLLARRYGGQFVLRVEDTDRARSTDESIQAILDGLKWLGLDWDEGPGVDGPHGPYFQSQRGAIYAEHIERLVASGHLYRCYCTREELDAKREAAMQTGRKPVYDRTCRDLDPAGWEADDRPYVLRLRAPIDGETVVDDLIRGRIVFPNAELSDQVVVRTNGDPLYNFVVVVDDSTMKISHVVRGDDHLSNTPKQVQLYQALGVDPPAFAHLPLILGEDKKRLSKRHGATNVMQYDVDGYLPDALVNFLVRLGWSHGDQELFAREELIANFGLDAVGKAAGVWNASKLDWVNQQWIQRADAAALVADVAPRIAAAGYPAETDQELLVAQIHSLQTKARTLNDFVTAGCFYWAAADGIEYAAKARKKWLKEGTIPQLKAATEALTSLPEWTEPAIEAALTGVMEAMELGMGKIAQPLRVGATGNMMSPGIYETLALIGRDKVLHRLSTALELAATPPSPVP